MECPADNLDPRIRRTRRMLFQALEQLLAEKSFEDISVQDIAERSTVNRATFYDHFDDKFSLLEEMIGERFSAHFATRMAGAEAGCPSAHKQLVLSVCDFLAELSSACQKHQKQFEPVVESRVKAVLRNFLLSGLHKHGVTKADAELRATLVSWALYGAALEWSRHKSTSPEVLAETILPLLQPALHGGGDASH
jgi:AcrR family transcriptional regulator